MKTVVAAQYCFHSKAQRKGVTFWLSALGLTWHSTQKVNHSDMKSKNSWKHKHNDGDQTSKPLWDLFHSDHNNVVTPNSLNYWIFLRRVNGSGLPQFDVDKMTPTVVGTPVFSMLPQVKSALWEKKACWWVCAEVLEGLALLQHLSNQKKTTTWKVNCSFPGLSSSLFNVLLRGPCPQKPHHGTNAEA